MAVRFSHRKHACPLGHISPPHITSAGNCFKGTSYVQQICIGIYGIDADRFIGWLLLSWRLRIWYRLRNARRMPAVSECLLADGNRVLLAIANSLRTGDGHESNSFRSIQRGLRSYDHSLGSNPRAANLQYGSCSGRNPATVLIDSVFWRKRELKTTLPNLHDRCLGFPATKVTT